MKFVLSVFLIAFAFSSCRKEEVLSTPVLPSDPEQTVFKDFIFTLDGTAYVPGNVTTGYSNGLIVRQGSTSGEMFRLTISDGMQPGYYPVYTDGPFKFEYSQDNFATAYTSYDGAVTVVSHDTVNHHVTGYYQCNLVMQQVAGTVNITKAEFNIYY